MHFCIVEDWSGAPTVPTSRILWPKTTLSLSSDASLVFVKMTKVICARFHATVDRGLHDLRAVFAYLSARGLLGLLQQPVFSNKFPYPNLALLQCISCALIPVETFVLQYMLAQRCGSGSYVEGCDVIYEALVVWNRGTIF